MKEGIHPNYYMDALVVCGSCGAQWRTGSTKKEIHLDICSNCHPFFTGTQRIVDTAGQVERFTKRLAVSESRAAQGETHVSKKQRRAAERAKRSSVPEELLAPAAAVETAPVAAETPAAAATDATAEASAASAPRERKPRPPRERKPREAQPESKPASEAVTTPEAASAPDGETAA
ncbi:50S ribosomal protein L31 [Anaerolineae bacterium CFX7]|nr:50S ribosomal protein L31 [Anaerolineae bacterium CFX7]